MSKKFSFLILLYSGYSLAKPTPSENLHFVRIIPNSSTKFSPSIFDPRFFKWFIKLRISKTITYGETLSEVIGYMVKAYRVNGGGNL